MTARRVVLLALCLSVIPAALAGDAARPATTAAYDYAEPKLLTGTLYEIGSHQKKVLYTFRRIAVQSGAVVHVERQFFRTNGLMAAVDKVVYKSNRLESYKMQDFQARVSGAVRIAPDPKDPARQQIFISYGPGLVPPIGKAQNLPSDIVYDDTVYPFMLAHWDDLMRGNTVKFRFISFEWERTFAFHFVKIGGIRAARPDDRHRSGWSRTACSSPSWWTRSSLPWKKPARTAFSLISGAPRPASRKANPGNIWMPKPSSIIQPPMGSDETQSPEAGSQKSDVRSPSSVLRPSTLVSRPSTGPVKGIPN